MINKKSSKINRQITILNFGADFNPFDMLGRLNSSIFYAADT